MSASGVQKEVVLFTCKKLLKESNLSGYHADTPITIKAEASSKADSCPN